MSVLVTGATGLIGSHVVDLLIEHKEFVRALVRPGEATDRLVSQGVDICLGDMKDRASLASAVTGVERVIHCAARTGPWGPRADYEAINVRGLEDLIELSLLAGVQRFVHVSSITVHGNDVNGSADEAAQVRIEPNPYSWSKVMGERVAEKFIHDRNAPLTIVRPGWVYGPRDSSSFGRYAGMTSQGKMIMVGAGKNHIPLIYVTDAAEGILLASVIEKASGQVYLLVNDEPVTQREYLAAMAAGLGVPPPRIRIPYRLTLILGLLAETLWHAMNMTNPPPLSRYGMQMLGGENRFIIKKARQELGFAPKVSLAAGVHEGLIWFRNTQKNKQ